MTNQPSKDSKRRQLYKMYELRRTSLNFNINAFSIPSTTRLTSTQKLSSLSRSGSITRTRNRCILTGRGRGVYRLPRLSRIAFRELASKGLLPGVSKASW